MAYLQKEVTLVWKHTHPDHKILDGAAKCIIVQREGKRTPVPIEALTPAEFSVQLAYARARLARCKRANKWRKPT
jgi:hypothetical protein